MLSEIMWDMSVLKGYLGSGRIHWLLPLENRRIMMLYDEAKRIDEEIRELCRDSKHPSRTMSKEVMRALNSELEKIRKRSKGGGGGRSFGLWIRHRSLTWKS